MKSRKSIRKYQEKPVSKKDFEKIAQFITQAKPLHKETDMDVIVFEDGEKIKQTFTGIAKLYAKVKAPHYLAFTSETKEGYLENIGFIGEQIVLRMTELGIATCWLGSPIDQKIFSRIANVKNNQSYIILIAFGYPETEFSFITNRKRLKIEEFVSGDIYDIHVPIIEALNIAPSAVNSQPWRVVSEGNTWHIYLNWKNALNKKILYTMNKIDIGIGISHIVFAAEELGYNVSMKKENTGELKKHEYITSIAFEK
ncbi:nitroreductase family protein [Tepidibacter aestuarii]|uniref:nitroreductase family protein n=1 Tax=Tepidibacter aestuarii TaxID=2925782 RepID=UPI0020C10032|nr:nitroreductase family protein [Tepidibacter aestuarii]CAH2214854.1 Nitroreductase [Tepidibacter aestuarii]